MAIRVDEDTKVICQGFTALEGRCKPTARSGCAEDSTDMVREYSMAESRRVLVSMRCIGI